jgi:IMP dehydrogenase
MGVPQLSAIHEAVKAIGKHDIPVIADGGIKYSGDIVKALAVGASSVMIGSLFAGTEEAPGEVMKMHEKKYKYYRGMGSIPAMKEGGAARYGQEVKKGKPLIAEGVEGLIPYKGTVEELVTQLVGGLRAGMYYIGAKTLGDLREKARFIKVSPAALAESHPHSIIITNRGDNY